MSAATTALRIVEAPDYEVHPFADIWPLMNGTEFDALCSDIEKNCQRVPIVIHQNKILDGRNRWNACRRLGIAAKTEIAQVQNDAEALALVVSLNVQRRDLIDAGARAMVAAKLCNLKRGSNQYAEKVGGSAAPSTKLRDDAAKMFGISVASINRAKQIIRDGDADTIEAVHQGKLKLQTALRRVNRNTQGEQRVPDAKPLKSGARVRIPAGETFAQFYKRISAGPDDIEKKAKAARIAQSTYRKIEAIVLLAERTDLSNQHRARCIDALEQLERTGQPSAPYNQIEAIAQRVWMRRISRSRPDPRIDRLANALVVIGQVTLCADDINLPYLDEALRKKALETISASIAALHRLRRRCQKEEPSQ